MGTPKNVTENAPALLLEIRLTASSTRMLRTIYAVFLNEPILPRAFAFNEKFWWVLENTPRLKRTDYGSTNWGRKVTH